MPDLDEGDLLYMPTTFPGIAPDKARQLLQQADRLIRRVPEVKTVFGKVGRAETATDPAPMEMIETTIQLKPRDQWRPGMTIDKIKDELERTVKFPGLTNAWLMPINARLQMLSTGIKTPVGMKIAGPDLEVIQHLGEQVEKALADLPATKSVFAERVSSGRYIKITPDRMAMGKVGLTVADTKEMVASAVGGMNLTEVVEGRERYPVNLRYTPDTRDSVEKLKRLPIVTDTRGSQVPLEAVARVEVVDGPDMIRTEDARLNGWVYVDVKDQDIGSYVSQAKQAVIDQVKLPPGYSLTWSGSYEHWERAKERLWLVVPLTLAIILVLLYLNFRTLIGTLHPRDPAAGLRRGVLADVRPGLPPLGGRGDRVHRAGRGGRRGRRGNDALPGPGAGASARRAGNHSAHPGGRARGGGGRGASAASPGHHDKACDHRRALAHHAGRRHGLGGHAAHRRSGGWRDAECGHPYACGNPRRLPLVEGQGTAGNGGRPRRTGDTI